MKKILVIIFSLLLTLVLIPMFISNDNKTEADEPNYLTFTGNPRPESKSQISGIYIYWKTSKEKAMYRTSTDSGVSWTEWQDYTMGHTIHLNVGDKVQFKGEVYQPRFGMYGSIAASGDVTSMINNVGGDVALTKECFKGMFSSCRELTSVPNLPSTTLAEGCYSYMFFGCTKITETPELPATTLSTRCYENMFDGCTSLTKINDIKATVTAPYCCYQMFINCESLTTIPTINTTEAADYCYQYMYAGCNNLTTLQDDLLPATKVGVCSYYYMFFNCSNIKNAPSLPATTLGEGCYKNMFKYCTSLTYASALDAEVLAESCYQGMYEGCKSLTKTPDLNSTTLAKACYSRMFYECEKLEDIPDILPATILAESCYENMFYNCVLITLPPELPSTNLAKNCYYSMFQYCRNMLICPELPATTLAEGCYCGMFQSCTSILESPELPATKLEQDCYNAMFNGCISLTKAPTLNSTTLAENCYMGMFGGCNKLTIAPVLPATTLATACYNGMFSGCSSLKKCPELPATILEPYCYQLMFFRCDSLTEPADISHVTELKEGSCYEMYVDCDRVYLVTAGFGKAWKTTSAPSAPEYSLDYMFNGTPSELLNDDQTPELGRTYYIVESPNYLEFKSEGGVGTVTLDYVSCDGDIMYRYKNTSFWHVYKKGTTLGVYNYNNLLFKGTNIVTDENHHFTLTGTFSVNGDVTSLTNGIGGNADLNDGCYAYMFKDCTSMISVPKLPSTNIAEGCYEGMFEGCTNITRMPHLPATIAKENCYAHMFEGCTKIEEATDIVDMTLAKNCYAYMFKDCTSLYYAPTLAATSLVESCYEGMFEGCTGLYVAPELPATTLADSCYKGMFEGCSKLLIAPDLPASVLTKSCYQDMFKNCDYLLTPVEISHVTTLAEACCQNMYESCDSLKVYTSKQTEYENAWVTPNATTIQDWSKDMFKDTTGDLFTPEVNTTYYVISSVSLLVEYDGNGSSSGKVPIDTNRYKYDDSVTVLGNTGDLTKTGHRFVNWNTDEKGTGTTYEVGSTFNIKYDTTLYANWSVNKYTITFKDGNKVLSTITQDYGTTIVAPGNPEKTGYTFDKWSRDIPATMPAENLIIYATWTPITYTITYHLDGGTETFNPTSYTIETNTITLYHPIKGGYTFLNFYNNQEFTGDPVTTIPKGSYGNKDLYAKYEAKGNTPYTVKHYIEKLDGTYQLKETENLEGTTDSTVTPDTKSYSGFKAPTKQSITIKSDGTSLLEYNYTRNSYNLIVTKGKGIDTCSSSNTYKYEEQVTLSATLLTGYDTVVYSGDVTTSSFTMPSKTTSVTISALPINYTITYHLNGGIEETNPTSYNIETETITLNIPSKPGYSFIGFYDNPSFTGDPITNIPKGSIGNKDLYAKWDIINFTITYHLDGGSLPEGKTNPATYTINTNTITLYKPIKNNHTFVDYYNNPEFTGDPITTIPKGSTGNKDLYAKYYDIYIKKEETNPTFDGRYGTISYQKGSTNDCKITLSEEYDVNNTVVITNTKTTTPLVEDQDFTVTQGSTKITILDSYLKKLDVGTYNYSITLTTTAAKSYTYYLTITINKKPEPTPPYRPVDTSCR